MKKQISIMLSVILLLCTVVSVNMPMTALADPADTTWQNDFEYSLDGNNIVLRKYKGDGSDVEIPAQATINGINYNVKLNNDCSAFLGIRILNLLAFF